MSFIEPVSIVVDVTAADIAASSQGVLSNSLVTALKRYRDNGLLEGVETQRDKELCNALSATTNVRTIQNQQVAFCDAYVCTAPYGTDNATALRILAENVFGLKPFGPYTATLTRAQA